MHLHLDCQFGMAGDMLLAALIDAGADRDEIVRVLRALPLDGFSLECTRTTRNGIAAMYAEVTETGGCRCDHTHGDPHDGGTGCRCGDGCHAAGRHHSHYGDPHSRPQDEPHDHPHDHSHGHKHDHEHGPEHDHKHDHEHGGGHSHAGDGGPHRHLADLLRLLNPDVLPARVRDRAERAFRIMAEAEATVHGQPVDKVHFHEISGIDTAVDVIGSCLALELLEVDSISAAPPAVGSGMVMCAHGIFPVPAPATLEILKSRNIPWRPGGDGERATPTGIALIAGLAESFGDSPEVTVTRIGYGAGRREFPDVPNLVRVIIGKPGRVEPAARPEEKPVAVEPMGGQLIRLPADESLLPTAVASLLPGAVASDGDRVVEFRFAVDDMTPEAVAYLCERCLSSGAVEAYAVSATMKKGRSGHEVTVLAGPERASAVADVIWRESTTFGMRVGERSRLVLSRKSVTVTVLGRQIRVKLGWLGGVVVRRQPEYEDCRAAALATGRPVREIFRLAEAAAEEGGTA